MILPTMNPEEIYREIMRDFEVIKRRGQGSGDLFRREMLRKKLQHEKRAITFKTDHLNEWQIVFSLWPKEIKTAYYLKGWDKIGKVAYIIHFINEEKFVVKYNTHFFKRYNERMNLGLTEPDKIIKHFFKNNFEHHMGQTEALDDGTRYTTFIYENGMGIGWEDETKKTIHIKTYISNQILTKRQQSLAEHIKNGDDDAEFCQVIKMKHMRNKAV